MRAVRYREIAEDLRRRIEDGEVTGTLPSEAQLGASYGASRVTVRRALEELKDVGLLDARQGYGWYVASDPLVQSLARLGTIEAQLLDAGIASQRRVLEFAFVRAPAVVRKALGGVERVLAVRRLNLADGEPFARVTVWCPSDLARHLSLADVERAPFYELLDVELGSATQTIGASIASPEDAELLGLPAGAAVLVCRRTTLSDDGTPVLHSEHVFASHKTEFVVNLPRADRSMAPSGLRLVE